MNQLLKYGTRKIDKNNWFKSHPSTTIVRELKVKGMSNPLCQFNFAQADVNYCRQDYEDYLNIKYSIGNGSYSYL